MAAERKPPRRRGRPAKNVYVTKNGKSIKVNRSLTEQWRARRDEKARKKAAYLSTLPVNRFKRILFRLQPKRVIRYWFSKEGLIMALKLVGIGIVVMFLLLIGLFAYFRKDLPNIKDVSQSKLGGSISYYDRTGTVLLWQDYNAVKRIPVSTIQMDSNIRHATVAIEDKNFYHEGAFDLRGIVRAGYHDVFKSGGGLQGGSTITQQLVKLNENWTSNRTISRKVKEIILAVELQREYSKDDILTGYLNVAPYGGVDYGVEAAAEDYFHATAATLTLPQAALLAAIPQSPDVYDPFSPDFDQGALIGRYDYILTLMNQQGYITSQQEADAKATNILATVQPLTSKYNNIQAPYFVLAAKNQLQQKYGSQTINTGGWKVITTVDMNLQHTAETLVANNLPNVERNRGDEEAMALESVPTGQMLALVGGVNFNDPDHGQINYAETPIPPGSSFKPYDYATFINSTNNAGAGSVLYDVQQPLPGYPCTDKNIPKYDNNANCLWDYDFKYPGPETIRYGLAGSRNVPAVKAMLSVVPGNTTASVNKVISTADSMMDAPNAYQCYSDAALTQTTQCYGSSAIGDGAFLHLDQHVNGDATLARLGAAIPNTYILKITDSTGSVIDQWTQPTPTQVIRPDAAYIVDNMLSDPNASYLPGSCSPSTCTTLAHGGYKFQHYNGWNLAVKTGTTNDNFDGLMTSWSTQFAVTSWVGYHTRDRALTAGAMEYLTEPLTRYMIEDATDTLHMNPVNWAQPSDIKTLPAYIVRNHVGVGSVEPSPTTDIFPSWYAGSGKSGNSSQTIDKVSGGVATSCTPSTARETLSNSNDNSFSADIFYPPNHAASVSTSVSTTDTVHNCGDQPPTVTITPSNSSGCDTVNGCSFTVTVQQGTHPLFDSNYPQYPGTINLIVNGQQVQSMSIPQSDCSSGSPMVCTVPISYTPDSSLAGQTINVSAQALDSVLYEGSSSSVSATVANTSNSGGNGNGNGTGGNNNGGTNNTTTNNTTLPTLPGNGGGH